MTREENETINMAHNDIEGRKSICLKSVQKDQELCNNNDDEKWKLSDFKGKNTMVIDSKITISSDSSDKKTNHVGVSDNSDNDESKENEPKPLGGKGN